MVWQTPRGTRDYLPKEMKQRNYLFSKMRKIFELYGYGEVVTPAFEDFELLSKKSGEEVEKEIYTFKDKSNRKLGLRFDPTVPIARIVSSNPSLTKPIKYYYITRMWRYDRPQAGRYREFWQAGLELIGTKTTDSDAEILAVASDLIKSMTNKEFYFKINSRKITEQIAKKAGIPKDKKQKAFIAIDKLQKISEEKVKQEMRDNQIPQQAIDNFFELIQKQDIDLTELQEIRQKAQELGVKNIEIDLSVIRGLDYYTGFVFETFIKDNEGIGSICSGGRYDKLVSIYSGKKEDTPAVGFGLGIDRIMDIIGYDKNYYPSQVFIANIKPELKTKAIQLTQQLRKNNISCEYDLMNRNFRKQLDYVNSKNIPYLIIIGPKEIQNKEATLKNMKTGEEQKIKLDNLINEIKKMNL